MENRDLQVRTFLNANGTPFYPKTRWSAIIDAPDIEATINNILEEGSYVSDANYVHTDNNFTDVLKEKLDGLRRETFQISGMYRNSVLTLDNVPSVRELSTMVSQCVVLTAAVLFADVSSNDIRLFYLKEFTGSEFIFSYIENKSSKVIESEIKIYSNGTYAIAFKEIEIPEPTKDVVVVKADISGTTVSNASHSYAQLIEHIQNGDVVLLELRSGSAFHFYSLTDTSRASGVEIGPLVFSRIFLNGSDKSASDSIVSLSQNNTWSYSETYIKIPESINDFYPTYYYQFQDGDTLRYDGSRWQVGNFDELPSQTGNSGKFLTTNGTNVSWAEIESGGGNVLVVTARWYSTQIYDPSHSFSDIKAAYDAGKSVILNFTISGSVCSYLCCSCTSSEIVFLTYDIPSANAFEQQKITVSSSNVWTYGWELIDTLPSQTGNNGKFLTTNGSSASWSDVELSNVSDISISNPSNNQVLKYNSTSQKWVNADNSSVEYGTTSYWNSRIGYIPAAGTIIVYTDYATKTVDNETVYIPNIKIGSGNGYVQDLAFVGEKEADDLLSHISNTTIHVTAADKSNWNSKLNVDDNNEVVNETLIFIRN